MSLILLSLTMVMIVVIHTKSHGYHGYTTGVHHAPRDPKHVHRGGAKFYLPPEPASIHPPCPIRADPAMATTRDDVKLIFGKLYSIQPYILNVLMLVITAF